MTITLTPSQAEHNAALGNEERIDGVDRCYCGCKYWEDDTCVDCGQTQVDHDA